MKLSFNKQPVDKTDTNQLSLFKNDFKYGDPVVFDNDGVMEYGYIITYSRFSYTDDYCSVRVPTGINYSVLKTKVYPADMLKVNTISDLEIGDTVITSDKKIKDSYKIFKIYDIINLYLLKVMYNSNICIFNVSDEQMMSKVNIYKFQKV